MKVPPALFSWRVLAWIALYTTLFILAGVYTGGLYWQAQYGPNNVCLLFVHAYRQQDGSYSFSAASPTCGMVSGIGILGLLLSLLLGGFALYFLLTAQARAKRVIQAFALVASMYTLVILVGASLATAGINRTCDAIETGTVEQNCDTTFRGGFYSVDGTSNGTQTKNLGTVRAAITASWLLVLGWGGYAAAEWWSWRVASQRWW
ncbi:hypothetical protein HDU86_002596 [Geranomyces michiganensis]|nr:hypothetical protein HDU86_002596 [Geranomyces michiganensis]